MMKKLLFFTFLLGITLSCTTEEQKLQKVIKDYLYHTLDDFKSYEPIEFQPSDSIYSDWTMDPLLPQIESDYARMKKISDSLDVESKRKARLGYSLDDVSDDLSMYIVATYYTTVAYSSKRDSIKNHFVSEFIGYGVNHTFRTKNRLGGTERKHYQFILSPDKTSVIMVNDIDAGEEITNHSKVFNKYELEERQRQKLLNKYPNLKDRGEAYLKDNLTKEGVNVTESGLQYRVIEKGNGRQHPRGHSTVQFKYVLRDINGDVIVQETDKPISARLDRVVDGISESLQLMTPGAKYEVCVPWNLAYGEKGTDQVPPFSVLVYELELLSIIEY